MSRTQKISKAIRSALIKTFKDCKSDRPFIFLSSGADSNCLLFAALEAGKSPIAVSFHMDGIMSRDFVQARDTAAKFNVPFIEVKLPTSLSRLQKDCTTLAKTYGARKKSDFECSWPMLHAFAKVAKYAKTHRIQHPTIYTGHAADIFYVLSKKGCMHFKDCPDDYRDARYNDPKLSQRHILPKIAADNGLDWHMPWVQKKIYNAFNGSAWDECNKPRQKEPSRLAFAEYLEQTRIYQHTNFQLGDSGIAKHFEILLDSTWNEKSYRSVVGVYNELVRRLGCK